MKRSLFYAIGMAVILASCQPQIINVNLEAEKAAIDSLMNDFYVAFHAGNADSMVSFFDTNALACGTDPAEFLNMQQLKEAWKQMMADTAGIPEMNFLGKREIRIAPDGNSASALEQYIMPSMSPQIAWRNSYHLVKTNNQWKIFVANSAFVPKNDEIKKINDAVAEFRNEANKIN